MPAAPMRRRRRSMRRLPTPEARRARVLGVAAVLLCGAASADEPRSPIDRDGWHVTLGPIAGAAQLQDRWLSAVGGEISVVRLRQEQVPALYGIAGGGVSYGGRNGGRLWLEAETAIARPLPLGLGVGAAVEVDRVVPPRPGFQATLWVFAGVIPYVRAGFVEKTGPYAELGIMFKVPIRFAY